MGTDKSFHQGGFGDCIAESEPWTTQQWFEEHQKIAKARHEDFLKYKRVRSGVKDLISDLRDQQAISNNWYELKIKRLTELIAE